MNGDGRDGRPTLEPTHPLFGLGYAKPVERRAFEHVDDAGVTVAEATVAEETPVALVYNGWPHVVMMCTPADIDEFALGFTLTEEIVERRRCDRVDSGGRATAKGIEVEIVIPEAASEALRQRGRSLVGRTGCGLCGVTTIDDALRPGTRRRFGTTHHAGGAVSRRRAAPEMAAL